MQNGDETTYLCHPSHHQVSNPLPELLVARAVDAQEPRSNLEGISRARKVKDTYQFDMHPRCGRCGRTKTDAEGRRTLLQSERARRSGRREVKDYG